MKRLLVLCIALTLPLFGFAATAITMVTSHGTIELELDEQRAPITVENFLNYVNSGYYNGTIFHRIIPNFMVQGGGFTPDMNQKDTVGQIENEAKNGLTNARGTIAMARTNAPHSATSQFFINHADNPFLDQQGSKWGYAVFGKVVSGMDIIDDIAQVKTGRKNGFQDVPVEPVIILSVTVH